MDRAVRAVAFAFALAVDGIIAVSAGVAVCRIGCLPTIVGVAAAVAVSVADATVVADCYCLLNDMEWGRAKRLTFLSKTSNLWAPTRPCST